MTRTTLDTSRIQREEGRKQRDSAVKMDTALLEEDATGADATVEVRREPQDSITHGEEEALEGGADTTQGQRDSSQGDGDGDDMLLEKGNGRGGDFRGITGHVTAQI